CHPSHTHVPRLGTNTVPRTVLPVSQWYRAPKSGSPDLRQRGPNWPLLNGERERSMTSPRFEDVSGSPRGKRGRFAAVATLVALALLALPASAAAITTTWTGDT